MTGLVEDSDDEFPELAVIIAKHGRGADLRAIGENPMKAPVRKVVQNQTAVMSKAELQSASLNLPSEDVNFSEMDVKRPKSRKRVLKGICDDQLLLPFDRQNERARLPTSSKRSKLQSNALLTRLKTQAEFKATERSSMSSVSEDEEVFLGDSTGLSDFIVNDSSSLEEDVTDDDIQSRPPRSTRRLVRGRSVPVPSFSQEGHSRNIDDGQSRKYVNASPINSKPLRGGDGCEEVTKGRYVATPPSSPRKTLKSLLSPNKGPRIPTTPHRPSMDAFWDPDVINEWNEEYSPRKTTKPQHCTGDDELEVGLSTSPDKGSQLIRNSQKHETKKSFISKKNYIAEKFLRELDEKITNGKVSEMAAPTGGIKIIWSKKLNTTAGRANWKRETMRSTRDADGKPETNITYRHYASIELAEKVIDDEERLLNVIAHEFCHLANFMVSGIRNKPHGREFKSWAVKCSEQFGDRGIYVTTKHSYDIDYKYVWQCTNCDTAFKRHSKSIDPSKHQCGSCKSKLVQIKPVPCANAKPSGYQLFMKENLRKLKEQNPGCPQKEIMTMLGKIYQENKASKLRGTEDKLKSVGVNDGTDFGFREESPDDTTVDLVMKKLDFLDLTSP